MAEVTYEVAAAKAIRSGMVAPGTSFSLSSRTGDLPAPARQQRMPGGGGMKLGPASNSDRLCYELALSAPADADPILRAAKRRELKAQLGTGEEQRHCCIGSQRVAGYHGAGRGVSSISRSAGR